LTYNVNQGSDQAKLPGRYYVGGFYRGADYQVISGGGRKRGQFQTAKCLLKWPIRFSPS